MTVTSKATEATEEEAGAKTEKDSGATALQPEEQLDDINAGLRLIRRKNGLTLGTDALLLAAFVRGTPRSVCVDLGSGTGVLPLLLSAAGKVRRTVALEVQPVFADLVTRNAAVNGMSDRIISLCADVRALDQKRLGQVLGAKEGSCADLVVSNPPYMRTDSGRRNLHDEKYIARHEVCGGIEDFCQAAGRVLRCGGSFFVVFRPDRLSELMQGLHGAGLEPKRMVFVHGDVRTPPSSVLVEARAGGAPSLQVLPPLILHDESTRSQRHRPLLPEAEQICDTLCWPDV